MIPLEPFVPLKCVLTVLYAVAILFTVFRFWNRCRTQRLWWDDWVALVPLTGIPILLAILWIVGRPSGVQEIAVPLFWLSAVPFLVVVWASRASLALSIARIFVPGSPKRQIALFLACLCAAIFIAMIVQALVTCIDEGTWAHHAASLPSCQLHRHLNIVCAITDIVMDICLVALPFYALWNVGLPRFQRRLILTLFSASFLTLLSALVYRSMMFSPHVRGPGAPVVISMMSHIEASISVIVCNLLVVVMVFYRKIFRSSLEEDSLASDREKTTRTHYTVERDANGNTVTNGVVSMGTEMGLSYVDVSTTTTTTKDEEGQPSVIRPAHTMKLTSTFDSIYQDLP
ncbi:hypothetical protein AMATHDRAFT_9358 [Amanita thiersii Skay4041]|uniref:Rhodopsin domain-containing protein n=1 Tax=Amanita thiersii Skay4041 TaxID=703135 RepID=A0A2A9N7F8_9AGAR|nr:hypothetical protein AMATHDRAFT_9358 [Amanita thiersii Skay4041]